MALHTVPYVQAKVVRDPMCINNKQVLAHEIFILMSIFQEVHVLGPVLDADGDVMTRTVDAGEEYQRLASAYGVNRNNDTPRVTDVFGPPHSSAWRDALANGLDNFDLGDAVAEVDKAPARRKKVSKKKAAKKAAEPEAKAADPKINADEVMARLDDLDIEYDPDAKPVDLVNLLYGQTVTLIQALGGSPDQSKTLEELTVDLDGLREQHEAA